MIESVPALQHIPHRVPGHWSPQPLWRRGLQRQLHAFRECFMSPSRLFLTVYCLRLQMEEGARSIPLGLHLGLAGSNHSSSSGKATPTLHSSWSAFSGRSSSISSEVCTSISPTPARSNWQSLLASELSLKPGEESG